MRLMGHHILVTGASSGIGRYAAKLFSCLGARVSLIGQNAARLEASLKDLEGEGHQARQFDLTSIDEIPSLVRSFEDLTGIFHCAGLESFRPISIIKSKDIEAV